MKQEINYDLMLSMQIRLGPKEWTLCSSIFSHCKVYLLAGKRGPALVIGRVIVLVIVLVIFSLVKCCVQEKSQEMYLN